MILSILLVYIIFFSSYKRNHVALYTVLVAKKWQLPPDARITNRLTRCVLVIHSLEFIIFNSKNTFRINREKRPINFNHLKCPVWREPIIERLYCIKNAFKILWISIDTICFILKWQHIVYIFLIQTMVYIYNLNVYTI